MIVEYLTHNKCSFIKTKILVNNTLLNRPKIIVQLNSGTIKTINKISSKHLHKHFLMLKIDKMIISLTLASLLKAIVWAAIVLNWTWTTSWIIKIKEQPLWLKISLINTLKRCFFRRSMRIIKTSMISSIYLSILR